MFQLVLMARREPGGWKSKCVRTDVGLAEDPPEQRLPEGLRGGGVKQKEADHLLGLCPVSSLLTRYCDGNHGDGAVPKPERFAGKGV